MSRYPGLFEPSLADPAAFWGETAVLDALRTALQPGS
jgi:hypothetical protein